VNFLLLEAVKSNLMEDNLLSMALGVGRGCGGCLGGCLVLETTILLLPLST